VVAHFHYVLRIGAVFAIIRGVTYWFPLFFGVLIDSKKLKLQFYLIFLGVNITFFPQHFLGLNGIPRRYSDYPDAFRFWNTVSSIGSLISLVGVLIFIVILWEGVTSKSYSYSVYYVSSSLEWINNTPSSHHTFNQINIIRG
jgi:cytochrome c oxidase subunit 1